MFATTISVFSEVEAMHIIKNLIYDTILSEIKRNTSITYYESVVR